MITVRDKYTQKELKVIPFTSLENIERALNSGARAEAMLRESSAEKRHFWLMQIASRLELKKELFINLLISEAGKPRAYAKVEVERSLFTLTQCAQEALRFDGTKVPIDYGLGVGREAFTKKIPRGLILCLTPFNFPLNLMIHKVGPALAVGCPVIVKPSPYTPSLAEEFAELLEGIDLPKGSFSVVHSSIEDTQKIIKDDRVKMISFTGSEPVGWMIKELVPRKKVLLELGGNGAVIVDESANIESAAKLCVMSAFTYSGQVCISTQRIFVHEKVFKKFSTLFCGEAKKIKQGNPDQEEVVVGPLISRESADRLIAWKKEAVSLGASVLLEGKIDESANIIGPTVLTSTKPEMKVRAEEVFGPFAIIEAFKELEEACDLINEGRFGLQAGVFTDSIASFKFASEKIQAGGIILNYPPSFRLDTMPYGGMKNSGVGREGVRYKMEELCEEKLIIY
jgi:acyl-CoA reductase-like NAD-dependent aldehyde dehydrogenase